MSNPFVTYGPNYEYATLTAYGLPYWIITRTGSRIFNCFNSFKRLGYPRVLPNLNLLLQYGQEYYNLSITIGPECKVWTRGSTVIKSTLKNNYFLAPWFYKPRGMEDLQAYQLCTYERFSDVATFYYGTNYGTLWSTSQGTYVTPYRNRPNKDGLAYLQYRINATHYIGDRLVDRRTLASHWISGYFVHNPNPEYYDTLCHRDNNPSNNYYKNLYWANQKENLAQASKDNRMAKAITNEILEEIVEARNKVVQDGGSVTKLYKKYASKLNITPEAIYYNIKAKIDKNKLLKTSKDNSLYNVNDFINKCTFINDYDVTYRYAILKSFSRPDAIITIDGRAFVYSKQKKNEMLTLSNKNKSNWFLYEDIPYLVKANKLIEIIDPFNKKQITDTKCEYLSTSTNYWKNIYNTYFNDAPWYLKYAKNVNIDFIRISSHEQYGDILNCYFLCNNGKIFSITSGEYLTGYTKKTSDVINYSLNTIDKTTITRSIQTLLEDFGLLSN